MDIIKFHNFSRKNEMKEQSISRIIMYHIDKIPSQTFAFPTNREKIRPMIGGRGKLSRGEHSFRGIDAKAKRKELVNFPSFLLPLLRMKRNPIRCLRPIMPDHNCVATTFLLPTIRNVGGGLSSCSEIETELLFPRCFRRRLPFWKLELDLKQSLS